MFLKIDFWEILYIMYTFNVSRLCVYQKVKTYKLYSIIYTLLKTSMVSHLGQSNDVKRCDQNQIFMKCQLELFINS